MVTISSLILQFVGNVEPSEQRLITELTNSILKADKDTNTIIKSQQDVNTKNSRKRKLQFEDDPIRKVKKIRIFDDEGHQLSNEEVQSEKKESEENSQIDFFQAGFNDADFHVVYESDESWRIEHGKLFKNEKLTELILSEKELALVAQSMY